MAELDLGRIKRNVGKMVDQGAPETEIDAYISGEGATLDAVREFKPGPSPDVAVDMAKGFGYGANTGIDAMLNVIGSPVRVPINEAARLMGYEGELIPELNLARRANVAPPETRAGRFSEAVGEVAGGSVLPFGAMNAASRLPGATTNRLLQQFAQRPGRAAAIETTSTAGAGSGVGLARDQELGPVAEVGMGLIGGFAAPNALNMGGRFVSGTRDAARYANRQIQRARNPEMAAYQDIADQAVKADFDLQRTFQDVAPQPSAQLQGRMTPAGTPFSADDMADIVSRSMGGEPVATIARDYGLNPATVRNYVRTWQDANPTPRNIIDIAKEDLGSGGAMPLSNQARADMAIADDPIAAERLIGRQREQPGRTSGIIEQSGVQGRNFDDEVQRLSTIARQEEQAAYNLARQNAQPVNVLPVIRRWRARRPQEGGEINNAINRAVDMFYRGGMVQNGRSGMRYTRAMDVIDDVPTYLERRQELDQMIARSMQDGRATPLTRELTQFRTDLNNAARRNNTLLRDADARFSENRTTERILDRGTEIGRRLTPQTRQALRDFRAMTPTQQELMRVGFERKLMDDALNVRQGRAAADQFGTEAFERIVNALYPRPRSPRGPQRTIEQQVYDRGQSLIRNLRRENITTNTTRDVLSGSRTAPLQDDMAELMEGPRAAANLATGRFGKVLEDLSTRLARQIGQRAARERVRILTETDPAQMLPMLRRLASEAQTSAQRQAYVAAIREFARVGRRPATDIGTVGGTSSDD